MLSLQHPGVQCRVCDPDVGVGAKQGICPGTCDRWYENCKMDYFAFRELRGTLVPCSHGSLICSELQVMSPSLCFSLLAYPLLSWYCYAVLVEYFLNETYCS